ncbi:hypothetical protein GJ744_003010 [Endocarpon pusillum]|uniref:Uncharacterized protein n=1 Tax=Endocarpon pusillum TaxID=364733 RepID=A0A8H7AAG6_9EURO|nr:hypothetical protein GJ744_003010 [Endocarpon pusillum]
MSRLPEPGSPLLVIAVCQKGLSNFFDPLVRPVLETRIASQSFASFSSGSVSVFLIPDSKKELADCLTLCSSDLCLGSAPKNLVVAWNSKFLERITEFVVKIDESSKGDEGKFEFSTTSSIVETRWIGAPVALRRAIQRLSRSQ